MADTDTLFFDFAKQTINANALAAARKTLTAHGAIKQFQALARGNVTNVTEGRAATHMRERAPNGTDHTSLRVLADQIAERGIRTIVNVGIGGSDLGLRLADDAFRAALLHTRVSLRFCAGLDPAEWHEATSDLDPATTAFVLASKSFTTLETLNTGDRAKQWLGAHATSNLFATTANAERAQAYGIAPGNISAFAESVGGRYSIWSSINLPLRVAYGNAPVDQMLAGAHALDQRVLANHAFESSPYIAAIARQYNRNTLGLTSQVIVPYAWGLRRLAEYLQQLVMESNGKRVNVRGEAIASDPCAAIWGTVGTAAQHAYFQWLHQHPEGAAVDIIAIRPSADPGAIALFENAVAQARALAFGFEPEASDPLGAHKRTTGQRPNTFIGLSTLSPYALGQLLAHYEASVFVEALLNEINPFDQFGVEYGKLLAKQVASASGDASFDGSTAEILAWGRGEARSAV
ncbi:MAG: glucose-6-phosphate isomerase [Betaproteobacteria bacterium]|nr:MAG: glucose-6-phosphate isomerase [Betaproteobacteria bacterium]